MMQHHHWHQTGRVWLWRYPGAARHFPGWHMTADAAGAASLCDLLDAFERQVGPSFRTVQISVPSPLILSVPNNRHAAAHAPARLRIALSPIDDMWRFSEIEEIVTLTIGSDSFAPLRESIAAMQVGEGDLAIGPAGGNQGLWFWWCLEANQSEAASTRPTGNRA